MHMFSMHPHTEEKFAAWLENKMKQEFISDVTKREKPRDENLKLQIICVYCI